MKSKIKENISLFDQHGQEIKITGLLNYGEDENIYSAEDQNAVKIFDPKIISQQLKGKIDSLIKKRISFPGICLPDRLVHNNENQFTGYIMPKAYVEPKSDLDSLFRRKDYFEKRFPEWTRIDLANLCLNILNKISFLHEHDILLGNINPSAILVNSADEVFFIDTENFQFDSYPSPKGFPYMSAPETWDIDSPEFMRTKEQEYYSVAALMLWILLPGTTSFSYQSEEAEVLRKEISPDLNKSFNMVFKENIRLSVSDWTNILSSYMSDIKMGSCSVQIFPRLDKNTWKDSSLNINRRDVGENEIAIRNGVTLLGSGNNIGVLELSTKAVKFLTAEKENVDRYGFNFDYFFRHSVKTETGRGLDSNNNMNMEYFNSTVIPSIKKMLLLARERKVGTLFSVATAAYRAASNREEIINSIREKCGINVQILSQDEEVIATLTAFVFSKPRGIEIKENDHLFMIDQGGGSTEISQFKEEKEWKKEYHYSLNLGTTVLKANFFKNEDKYISLDHALRENDKFIKSRLSPFYSDPESRILRDQKCKYCVSVGTAITNATGKRGNASQHGTILSVDMIKARISETESYIKREHSKLSSLLEAVELASTSRDPRYNQLDNIVTMRLGLPMYIEIMEEFGIDEVIVSGTGLWYGIYFEHLLLQ